jgi:hypothetical protein
MNETTTELWGLSWPWHGAIVEVDADRRTWRYYRCAESGSRVGAE